MNADLYPPPACLGLRVIAYCLDIGVGILHAMIWSYTGTFMFMVRAWWPLAVSAVLSLLIMGAWFILAARGRTIGKVFVGLHVILIDGNGNHRPPSIPRMLAQAVIKVLGAVMVLPVFLDLWLVLSDRSDCRTIADRVLNSRVVAIPPGAEAAGPGSTTVNLEPKA